MSTLRWQAGDPSANGVLRRNIQEELDGAPIKLFLDSMVRASILPIRAVSQNNTAQPALDSGIRRKVLTNTLDRQNFLDERFIAAWSVAQHGC